MDDAVVKDNTVQGGHGMHLKTILNRVQKHSSFVYGTIRLIEAKVPELEIEILPRKGSRGRCSGCEKRGRTYDHLPSRRYQFVPMWGILDCARCGVTA